MSSHDMGRNQNLASLSAPMQSQSQKKRKFGQRDHLPFSPDGLDMKMAMGMAVDMGLAGEDEEGDLLIMNDEQMVSYSSSVGQFNNCSLNPLLLTGIWPTYRSRHLSIIYLSPRHIQPTTSMPMTSHLLRIPPFPQPSWTNIPRLHFATLFSR